MPRREDETARRVFYSDHPPTCTCVVCTRRRLKRLYGYPKWFWIIAILLPPVGSIIVGFVAGFRYHSWVAGFFMVVIGIAILWFAYTFYWGGNVWELLEF